MVYVFKRCQHHYIVIADSDNEAWNILCKRQSCRVEIAKYQYKLITTMNNSQTIIKI